MVIKIRIKILLLFCFMFTSGLGYSLEMDEIQNMKGKVKENKVENKAELKKYKDSIKTEKDSLKRKELIATLGETKDDEYRDTYFNVIKSSDEIGWVKLSAVESVGKLEQSTTTASFLIETVLDKQQQIGVRRMALKTLGKQAQPVTVMIEFLENSSLEDTLRLEAMNVLIRYLQDERVINVLKAHKNDKDKKIAGIAVNKLGLLGIK
ncbi:MAG: hypothetical protein A2252_05975 [Elusimicrobia bacterium RIFOXYA2_FULL_39_19]|nr:MAG: hypothetical protein A2252_05975 [Elusimicrobia bacterium RIFOXYA2_FULL_39_19]